MTHRDTQRQRQKASKTGIQRHRKRHTETDKLDEEAQKCREREGEKQSERINVSCISNNKFCFINVSVAICEIRNYIVDCIVEKTYANGYELFFRQLTFIIHACNTVYD